MSRLTNRDFLKETDFTSEDLIYLLDLAAALKKAKQEKREPKFLLDKNIVLLFEKDSTRTRCSFEVAAHDQGAHTTYLGPSGSQIGKKESMADTARVLSGFYDGIEYRGFGQSIVEELARFASVPVWNGLTNEFHPTQILADFLTIREHFGKLKGIKPIASDLLSRGYDVREKVLEKVDAAREDISDVLAEAQAKSEERRSDKEPVLQEAAPAQPRPAAGSLAPYPEWAQITQKLQEVDPMLYSYLRKSKAYFDGTRVLIDGGKTFRDFIRANKDSQRLIKKLILQVSGKAIPIGPYEPRTAGKAVSNAEQSLHALEKLGLDVSIEDTARKQK